MRDCFDLFSPLGTLAGYAVFLPMLLGPFYGAIAVPSVTRCRCRRRRCCCCGHRRAAARSGEWAQHFSNAFVSLFLGRHSRPVISESHWPIFTKISGLVDGWNGLLSWYITLRSLNERCHDNQLKSKNRRFSRTNLLCRAAIPKWLAISQFQFHKFKWHELLCIV